MVRLMRTAAAISLLLVFASFAAMPTLAQTPILTTETPFVVSGVGNVLTITSAIINSGTVQIAGFKVTAIQLSTAPLIAPSSFPAFAVSTVPPGGGVSIGATFNSSGLVVGKSYLLTIRGTYVLGSSTSGFAMNRFVAIPSPPKVSVGINKTDSLLLQVNAASGNAINYFGNKDSNGLATQLTTVLVQAKAGGTSRFDVDAEGRPVRLSEPDGTTFNFVWTSATSAQVTAISPNGSQTATVTVDASLAHLTRNQSLPGPAGDLFAAAESWPMANQSGGGHVGSEPLAWKAVNHPGPFASAVYCNSSLPQGTTGGSTGHVHVDHCGPVHDANVALIYNPGTPATLPAANTPGTGDYTVSLPTFGAVVGNFGEACTTTSEALSHVCAAAKILPFLVLSLDEALSSNPGLLTFLEAAAALDALATEYCEVLGGGTFAGAPNVFQGFCTVVTQSINLATASTVMLQAVVTDVLGSQSLAPVEVDATAPATSFTVLFPCFALDGEWIGSAVFFDSGGGPSETDPVSATFTSVTTPTTFTVTATVVFTEQGGVPETHNVTYQVTGSKAVLSGDITMTGTITADSTGQIVAGTGFDAEEGNSGTGTLTFSNGGNTMKGNITSGTDLSPGSGTLTISANGKNMTGTASTTDGSTLTWTAVKQ